MSMPSWAARPGTLPRLGRRLGPPTQLHHGKALAHPVLHMRLVHGLLDGQYCELRYPSPVTHREVGLVVRYAVAGRDLVVLPDMADRDGWWRAFTRPHPARVLLRRRWCDGTAHAAMIGQSAWREAARAYTDRFPNILVEPADIFVIVTLQSVAG